MSVFLHFFSYAKSENRRTEQVLSWWEGGGSGRMMKEGRYGANAVYTCM
jgi:streptomycin 6-kinase